MAFSRLAAEIWRDFNTWGVPSSGDYEPEKAKIRQYGGELEAALSAAFSNVRLVRATRSELFADLDWASGTGAWVMQDTTAAYNGVYRKFGNSGTGSWTRYGDLPYGFIPLEVVGASFNAIVTTSVLPEPQADAAAMFVLVPDGANTGPVTVKVNDGTALPLRWLDGAVIPNGGLQPGVPVLFFRIGGQYRIPMYGEGQINADAAAASAALAALWATKTSGNVADGDASAKAWSIGGAGVTDTAGRGAAKEWAVNPEDETVDGTNFSALHHSAKSNAARLAAEDAATTSIANSGAASSAAGTAATKAAEAVAAASSAAALLGATLFATKAAADTGLAGIAANAFVLVLADETRGGQIAVYQKVSGSYVFRRTLADASFSDLYEKQGNGVRLRKTQHILALRDRNGLTGPGNPDFLPKTLNLSQSGNTVTAGSSFFAPNHVGCVIEWATGEEAVITAVPAINPSPGVYLATATTCTVDRAQTISSSSAVVNAKSLVECIFGNSISHPVTRFLTRRRYRQLGFGGYVFSSGNVDATQLSLGAVTAAGGATESATTTDYATLPWSRCFSLPSGGSFIFELGLSYGNGVYNNPDHGLRDRDLITDTAVMTFRRGAGAITIERQKRSWPNWETVETIADTNAGSDTFLTRKYKHTLGPGWRYRITGTSGTVKIVTFALLNRTTPGYVPWNLYTSGNDIANFILLPAADFEQIVRPLAVDLHTFHMAGGRTGVTDPNTWLADFTTYRSMWNTAAGTRGIDHQWISPWEPLESPAGAQAQAKAYGDAIRMLALAYDDGYLSFETLFGDYATKAFPLGWIQDSVHPSPIGSHVGGAHIDRIEGISDHQNVAEDRPVKSPLVEADVLRVAAIDVAAALRAAAMGPNRGAKWLYGTSGHLGGNIAADIGTGDFTIIFDAEILANAPAVRYLATVGPVMTQQSGNGSFILYQSGTSLIAVLTNGSGVAYNYTWTFFGTAYGGTTRSIALRSNRAGNRLDLFVDGEPVIALSCNPTGSGTPIDTWSGVGTNFFISQAASNTSANGYYYSAMFFSSALTDAQIFEAYVNMGPGTLSPQFWWDFREQGGRLALDESGNGRDGMWQLAGTTTTYGIGALPSWRGRSKGLNAPWVATDNAITNLFAGDDVLTKYTSSIDMQLPATPKLGDVIRATKGSSAAQTRFKQAALHQIKIGAGGTVGTNATTIGVTGFLTLTDANSSAHLMCSRAVAGTAYEWVVIASGGALGWT